MAISAASYDQQVADPPYVTFDSTADVCRSAAHDPSVLFWPLPNPAIRSCISQRSASLYACGPFETELAESIFTPSMQAGSNCSGKSRSGFYKYLGGPATQQGRFLMTQMLATSTRDARRSPTAAPRTSSRSPVRKVQRRSQLLSKTCHPSTSFLTTGKPENAYP